jgi:putative transposase
LWIFRLWLCEEEGHIKRGRFSEGQIIAALKGNEAGAGVDELCREHGISSVTFYAWRKEFGGMEASDTKRLCALEGESGKLKRIVAEQMLDMAATKEFLQTLVNPWRIVGLAR